MVRPQGMFLSPCPQELRMILAEDKRGMLKEESPWYVKWSLYELLGIVFIFLSYFFLTKAYAPQS